MKPFSTSNKPTSNIKNPGFPGDQAMLDITSFSCFNLLPKEIRLMIWEVSVQPRLIKLEYCIYSFDIRNPPTSAYLLGGDFPYEHFRMDDAQRPAEPYRTGHLFPTNVTSPAALAVNQESRQCLLGLGYRSWTLEHPRLGIQYIMWCPSVDTILFPISDFDYDGSFLNYHRRLLSIFKLQYPTQVAQSRRIALPSSYWPYGSTFAAENTLLFWTFTNLEEIVMVLNKEYERSCVDIKKNLAMHGHLSSGPWIVPKSIAEYLREILTKLRRSTLGRGNIKLPSVPSVRVAWTERDVTNWSRGELDLALRCYPCEHFPC